MISIFEDLFIFEMANSHQGSVEHGIAIIKEMAKICRRCNIKGAVKLQYRELDSFIHTSYKGKKDAKQIFRFESTRLKKEDFDILVEVIREEGMIPVSTPFDETGVEWCMRQGLPAIKIASCSSTDWPLMEEAAKTRKPLLISTGGKSIADIDKIYNFLTHRGCEFALMHCVAEYPAAEKQIQLDFIDRMKKRYQGVLIGYSGHENPGDYTVPMLAVAKGIRIFERHVGMETEVIKLNAYSMNPKQAEEWVRAILRAKEICGLKKEKEKYISQSELESLHCLMRGVYAKESIPKGSGIHRKQVYFAMPYQKDKGQMSSGEFIDGIQAQNDYEVNAPICEQRMVTDINVTRSIIHDIKGLIYEAGIALGSEYEIELSHHYGMKNFRQTGATIINVINRAYCKKLIVVLPGQNHPEHFHKEKEESFQVLYGDLECEIEGSISQMEAGDIITVPRGKTHSFTSRNGAVFEEISTTHKKGDSYYTDETITKRDIMERKTIIKEW